MPQSTEAQKMVRAPLAPKLVVPRCSLLWVLRAGGGGGRSGPTRKSPSPVQQAGRNGGERRKNRRQCRNRRATETQTTRLNSRKSATSPKPFSAAQSYAIALHTDGAHPLQGTALTDMPHGSTESQSRTAEGSHVQSRS